MSIDTTTDLDRTDLDRTRPEAADAGTPAEDAFVEEELLVEEVSIDGMCGVY